MGDMVEKLCKDVMQMTIVTEIKLAYKSPLGEME